MQPPADQNEPATIGGTPRATVRPPDAVVPAHWAAQVGAPPVPAPGIVLPGDAQPTGRDPVRYGDWEYKGMAIDF